jgi:hypothetical protein
MKFAKRPGILLGFFLVSLLSFATMVYGEANLLNKPILYPGTVQAIQQPDQLFQQAAREGNLLLFKAAIFDPARDGEPDLSAWVPNLLKGQPLEARYCVVQFAGPIRPENRQALEKAGARVIEYIPNNALLVRLPAGQVPAVSALADVRWVGDFQPAYKLAPELAAGMPGRFNYAGDQRWQISVDFFPDEDLYPVVQVVTDRFVSDPRYNFHQDSGRTVVFDVSTANLTELLNCLVNRNEVKWVEERPQDKPLNDNSIWVCQSGDTVNKTTPIFAQGILGQGQVVAVADSGLDKDHCAFINTAGGPVLASQTVNPPNVLTVDAGQRKLIAYNVLDNATDGDSSNHEFHGTHVSGSVGGDDYHHLASPTDPGHDSGDGMAPMAQLILEDGGNSTDQYLYFPWPFYDMWSQEKASGANIASNSWGSDNNQYNTACTYTDQFVWDNEDFLICVAAGNAGPMASSLNYLSTSKNVIAVAATSNGSQGANYIAVYSSKGPAADGRLKPDIAAPGDYINSAEGALQANNCDTWQMSGTSMATPTLAGLGALVREYFTEGWYPTGAKDAGNAFTPSAALLKAVLVNSCVNLTGGNTGSPKEDAPAIGQGWGRVTLDTALYFSSDARKLLVWDVPNAQGLTTGGVREYPITVTAGQSLKVSLAWTDPPGSSSAAITLVDDLDLEVVGPTGTVYRGNQWNGAFANDTKESAADPAGADGLNNVEGVLLRTPAAGNYTVRVKGVNIPGYGVKFRQGYGLAVTGGVAVRSAGVINVKSVTVDDSAGNNNGIIDPGETINLTVELENTGSASAGTTTATLSTGTTGITVTAASGSYGTIGGLSTKTNSAPYTFTVAGSVANSSVINFTLTITTGSAGNFTRQFALKVKPSTPPTLSNFAIGEYGLHEGYNSYVDIAFQFDYADPDIDIKYFYLYFKVNGRDVNMLPLPLDLTGGLNSPSGTGAYIVYIWIGVATNVGETLQLSGYLEDNQGNKSGIVQSNTMTFTEGFTPSTPSGLDDDDSMHYNFPGGFSFPFYGNTYTDCWINSDGNLSFEAGYEYQSRNPIAFLNNMPRIAGLYTDLAKNPGDGKITVEPFADHIIFHYTNLPQWSQISPVGSNTVHITLWLDGSVDFQFGNCTMSQSQEDDNGVSWKGVVGLCPGAVLDAPSVDLSTLGSTIPIPTAAPIYQGFRNTDTFDLANTTLHFEPETSFIPMQTVYFPRLSFDPGHWAEGYGFVNTGATQANVQFTAYGPSGAVIDTSDLVSWPAHGQGAYQIDGILGLTQATDGWVKADSDQAGMLGFFLTQEFSPAGLAGLDGAEVWTDTTSVAYLPLVKTTGTFSTELFIANPGSTSADVTLTGYDGAATLAGGTHAVPAGGFIKLDVATAFGAAFDGALKAEASGGTFIGNAVIKDGDSAMSSLNFMPSTLPDQNLYASHVVLFPDVYYTEINLFNPNGTAAVATITPYKADGTTVSAPFQVNVPANQVISLRDTELGLPSGESTEGWLAVDSDQPLVGCLTFGNPVDNHYMSTLPLQSRGASDLYFAQVANGNVGGVDFFTGIAVVNPSASPVDVTISVYASDGTLYGSATRTLAAGEKYVRLLQNIEGIGSLPAQSSGYIHVTSTGDVFSFVLFGDSSLNFLSAVPAQSLPLSR